MAILGLQVFTSVAAQAASRRLDPVQKYRILSKHRVAAWQHARRRM